MSNADRAKAIVDQFWYVAEVSRAEALRIVEGHIDAACIRSHRALNEDEAILRRAIKTRAYDSHRRLRGVPGGT